MREIQDIETQVERDRAALGQSLNMLTEVTRPDRASADISNIAHEYGGEIGRQAWHAAQNNPAAFALVGAGIGLLLTGTGARASKPAPTRTAVPPKQSMIGFDDRVASADAAIKKEMSGMTQEKYSASQLRKAMDKGLESLPAPARKRVLQTRRAAVEAQERVEASVAKLSSRSKTFMDDQPLAVGAVAFGLGALIGALLPSTRREDALLGERRDALMRAAEATLREEMNKAHAAASATLQDATSGDQSAVRS
ncbi:hypothetical protein [Thalassococcus sp. S3]|uniref:hypothetical protein n=1 Tax=Thalassococcus sp. S3 TaxID=2017482 RepID=UPI0010242147|nr:hypothetical protein [Thalassococcus sp. S3]QBF33999.1 hypothetical protein CFI11_22725 [Thalassococcus sp. S3]